MRPHPLDDAASCNCFYYPQQLIGCFNMVNCITWVLLFVGWLVSMVGSISIVAGKISLLGTYHSVKLGKGRWKYFGCECGGTNNERKECFYEKFIMVLKANFVLSLVLLPTYLIVISEGTASESIGFFYCLCLSALLTLVSLMVIRLLSNHSKSLIVYIVRIPSGKSLVEVAKERNEKTLGHFHTLICTAWMALGIYFTAGILNGKSISQSSFPSIPIESVFFVFCVFILAMPFLTFIVEFFFLYSPPIIKIPVAPEKIQISELTDKQVEKRVMKKDVPPNNSKSV